MFRQLIEFFGICFHNWGSWTDLQKVPYVKNFIDIDHKRTALIQVRVCSKCNKITKRTMM